jgi:hypothetical protein
MRATTKKTIAKRNIETSVAKVGCLLSRQATPLTQNAHSVPLSRAGGPTIGKSEDVNFVVISDEGEPVERLPKGDRGL